MRRGGGMGESGLSQAEEGLKRQVRALREALERSEENARSTEAVFDSVDNHASAIDAAMRPVEAKMHTMNKTLENLGRTIEAVEGILAKFDITHRAEDTISKGPHEDLKTFLEVVDQLKGIIGFSSSKAKSTSNVKLRNRVNDLLTTAAKMIEDEFRQLMDTCSKPIEPDCLFDCLPKLICTPNGTHEAVEEEPSQSSALYMNPTLIPPRVLPLLHDIAQQLVQDGNQQSCYKIYRLFVDRRPLNIESIYDLMEMRQ